MKESINVDRVPYGLAVHDSEEEEAVLEVIKNQQSLRINKNYQKNG